MSIRRDRYDYISEISISLASPGSIKERSHGEVLSATTRNYRTGKSELGGLGCERIFGPEEDWKCHCGKYQGIKYRYNVCDQCGVEINERKVRRHRMGHIELVIPVAHIWYFRYLPNKISCLLGIPSKSVEEIIYFKNYVVLQPGPAAEQGVQRLDCLTDKEYETICANLPADHDALPADQQFIAGMGAEAIETLLKEIDLEQLSDELRQQARDETSQQRRADALKRLRVVEAFRKSQKVRPNKPEWMILRQLPVISPELRPLFPLGANRFAMADLTDLYRLVIFRNKRLRDLMDLSRSSIKVPWLILRHQMRLLQEAVNALLDNSRRASAVTTENDRPLKSLSDNLKGKQGRFRKHLLGKRVEFSARSVIVPGPLLKLHECGLPKAMALELFKPFVIGRLMDRGIVKTVREATCLIEAKVPVIWDVLTRVVKGVPVLLNRAPTLHRLSIQAFEPRLVEGRAIQLHPLVCTAFNADFDGDQMAVHVPLSQEAIAECSLLMLASNNILNPANGQPITIPARDILLGLYYLTQPKRGTTEEPVRGEGRKFSSAEEVLIAYETRRVDKHAVIQVRLSVAPDSPPSLVETTVGRVIFNQVVPASLGYINEQLNKQKIQSIITELYKKEGNTVTATFLDDVKALGFRHCHEGGLTFGLDDVKPPKEKPAIIEQAQAEVDAIWQNYYMGVITNNERYNQVIDVWTRANRRITNHLIRHLEQDKQGFNSIYSMMNSGARGSREQVRQIAGMRGLMARPQSSVHSTGDVIETPVLSNFIEGLDVGGYFTSTHGARKGMTDTAIRTADAGYLARKMVDVAQDVVVREEDCKALRGTEMRVMSSRETENSFAIQTSGRVTLRDVYHPGTGELIVAAREMLNDSHIAEIEKSGLEQIEIRSAVHCQARHGVCRLCYGENLANGKLVHLGEAVGVIAAQSIAEPGTQLTLRTFHQGGAAMVSSPISELKSQRKGVLRFENVQTVQRKNSKGDDAQVVISKVGEVWVMDSATGSQLDSYHLPYGSELLVREGQQVERDDALCVWDAYNALILAHVSGVVHFESIEEEVTCKEEYDEHTGYKEKIIIESKNKHKVPTLRIVEDKEGRTITCSLPVKARLLVENGQRVEAGQILAKVPRASSSRMQEITGGLPRVTEVFEARVPANAAVVSSIDGIVSSGGTKRGNREIIVTGKDGTQVSYMVPLSKLLVVQDGDFVKAGSNLSEGVISILDLLAIKGPSAVHQYILEEIQAVYRLQGVRINNKHFEVLIRQMMSHVEILDPGDTEFIPGQLVSRGAFYEANGELFNKQIVVDAGDSELYQQHQIISEAALAQENKALSAAGQRTMKGQPAVPATAAPKLQGITRAALGTESFLSAASFQETPRVLSEAAIAAKTDTLRDLKGCVIVGQPIDAGTGLRVLLDEGPMPQMMRDLHEGPQAKMDRPPRDVAAAA